MVLERIQKANDIKKLSWEEQEVLAAEIRQFLVEKVSKTGGHLASNLGVVELTIAMHLAFSLPKDKMIWDVGHQAYTHKILTGRKDEFDHLRQYGGMSGFPKRKESTCDSFDTGHSSTSISAGLGYVEARELLGENYKVVSVIGDGSLTGGMAYEALNNAAHLQTNFIIVLNDNNMSISENVGGMSKYLNGIRTAEFYNNLKKGVLIRHLMLPNLKEDSKKIIKYIYDTYKDNVYISIMNQYTPIKNYKYEELNNKITNKDYEEIIDYAYDLGIRNAYVQEEGTVDTSFIPDFKTQNF